MGTYLLWLRRTFNELKISAVSYKRWGVHAMRNCIDQGYHRFRPLLVGNIDVWK